MFREFDYQADGETSFVHDRVNSKFDRAFSYDFAGRLTQALTGYEARGEQYGVQGPFKQVYQHDAWDNTTVRNNRHWSNFFYYSAAYDSHNREVNDPAWQYDAAGQMTQDDQYRQHKYDAAGRKVEVSNYEGAITQSFDGDGQRIKQVQTVTNPASSEVTYYLRSSVLRGATVTELYATGNKKQTNVYAGSAVIARQQVAAGPNIWGRISQTVAWQYSEPVTGSGRSDDGAETSELDPLGVDAGLINPYIDPNYDSDWPLMKHGDAGNPGSGCMLNGSPENCRMVALLVEAGRARRINVLDPLNPGSSIEVGRAIWVPDDSLDTGDVDLDSQTVTIRDGGGGRFEWVPNGSITTYINQRQTLPQNPVSPEDLRAYGARIESMLKVSKCSGFLNQLLNQAKEMTGRSYGDILTTFNQIKFYWGETGGIHGGYAYFEHGVPAATIDNRINTEKMGGSLANQRDRHEFLTSSTTQHFFGETLHHVGIGRMYGDGEMANALNAILVKGGLDTPRVFSDKTPEEVDNASRYWHPKVWDACPAPRR